jgi:hypothetical protein
MIFSTFLFFCSMHLICSGEDALANLSVEKLATGAIVGHVRIRSKTQGIALSLGDKITMGERSSCPSTHILGLSSVLISFSQIINLNYNRDHEALARTA